MASCGDRSAVNAKRVSNAIEQAFARWSRQIALGTRNTALVRPVSQQAIDAAQKALCAQVGLASQFVTTVVSILSV